MIFYSFFPISRKLVFFNLGTLFFSGSLKYQFVDIVLPLAEELQLHYSAIEGNRKKFEEYSHLLEKYNRISTIEQKAKTYYGDISLQFVKSRSIDYDIGNRAKAYAEELLTITKEVKSYWLGLCIYNMLITYHQQFLDYSKIIEVCKAAIKYFESFPYPIPPGGIRNFLYKKIPAQIVTGQYEEAENNIKTCLELAALLGHNWIMIQRYQVILSSNRCFRGYDGYGD